MYFIEYDNHNSARVCACVCVCVFARVCVGAYMLRFRFSFFRRSVDSYAVGRRNKFIVRVQRLKR